jgi:outer membrane cobalamin receptor
MAFLPLSSIAQQAASEDPVPDDLQSLLNTPVAVASIKEMTLSESPAILTVITREDMDRFGLRYLSDISQIIPGISFGCDVLGVVGIGIRNNWAHEGKALIMLDGIELNEELYANTQFGNHYSLDNIEKIEVIRGPGSVMHGGTAALAVINMITKNSSSAPSFCLNSVLSYSGERLAERGGSVAVSNGTPRSGFSLYSRYSRDIRSHLPYTDINGNSFSLADFSEIENATILLNGRHKGWVLNLLYDDYSLQSKDGYIDITENASDVRFENIQVRLKKSVLLNSQLEITPYLNYKNQKPWTVIYENKNDKPDEIVRLQKLSSGMHLTWSLNDYHSLAAGIEHWTESATSPDGAKPDFIDYNNRFTQQSYAAFIQTTSKLRYWSFSPGVRYSYSTQYFSSCIPRIAITRNWNWGFSKIIASRSYRSPSIMNILANSSIKPEFATVLELETGVSFKAFSVLSVNIYQMLISDPITYYYDEATFEDKYINEGKAGTQGVELSFNHHFPSSKLIVTASLSQPVKSNNNQLYKVEGHRNYLIGFSPYQFSVNYSFMLSPRTTCWSVLHFNGRKYGISSLDGSGKPVFSSYKESCLIHTGLKRQLDKEGRWSIAVSVNNVLDQPIYYVQPYNSLHGALPGKGRELGMILNYQIK